jgi:hypothetical protein
MFLFISYNITLLSQSEEIDFFCFSMALIIVKVSNCIIIYVLCLSWFQVMFCVCLDFKWCFVIIFISSDVLWLPLFQMLFYDYLYFKWCFVIVLFQMIFCDYLYFKWCFVIAFISNDILWLSLFQMMFCDYLYFKWNLNVLVPEIILISIQCMSCFMLDNYNNI